MIFLEDFAVNTLKHHPIKRALISVSDKSGLLDFSKALNEQGIELIATGGTAKLLSDNHIPVTEVADYTGFPEILGGRVKSLHPKIHAGLLARRGIDEAEIASHHIPLIDLLVVNLYPFQRTIAQPDCTQADAIENIDIGGPTLLRAGAKNCDAVTVVVNPQDYDAILQAIKENGGTTSATRLALAQKSFAHVAQYDTAIAAYLSRLSEKTAETLPACFSPQYTKKADLRYGENPQQRAALYTDHTPGLAQAKQFQGKPLSFNNLMDGDCALRCVQALPKEQLACVIVKHATPCGVAAAEDQLNAYLRAFATDPSSAFGGIIAFNTRLEAKTTETILSQQFVELIIAPDFETEALACLAKKPNIRALACDAPTDSFSLHSLSGGLLVQEADVITPSAFRVVTKRQPTPAEMQNLQFAWRVVKYVKSNAIVYAKNQATLGIGTGQTSRVFAAKIAILKAEEAGLSLKDAAMASDAFFPFADGVEVAAQAGICAVIQPGGSKRDDEVIAAADAAGLTMVFTGLRHFRH